MLRSRKGGEWVFENLATRGDFFGGQRALCSAARPCGLEGDELCPSSGKRRGLAGLWPFMWWFWRSKERVM